MAYHADVGFLEGCSPKLIERNAEEFARIRDLLSSIEPLVIKARDGTIWESEHREHYDARCNDARDLLTGLCAGFEKARVALLRYADGVEQARMRFECGVEAERRLDGLICSVAVALTPAAQRAEPMRRWEDIRSTTGFLDWVAELGMDVDGIREEATRAYDEASEAFGQAQSIERAAREECLSDLRRAQDEVPEFRRDFRSAALIVSSLSMLQEEIRQAQADPNVGLPGAGMLDDSFPAGSSEVSPALRRIRDLVSTLPAGVSPWQHEIIGGWTDGERRDYITNNRQLINVAARESGLPPDLLAGIAWREIGGKPYLVDNVTDAIRQVANSGWSPVTPQNLPLALAGDPDHTSFGPMAVQVRRAAEVLGYDPSTLSESQRTEIVSALKDPTQNMFIAAKYLENLKAESGFAQVPADQMTPAQYQELAARYNGGPDWQGGDAQRYGGEVVSLLDQARVAMR